MTDFTRRASDASQDRIRLLIEDENDPKDRAFLIVLQQINESLVANTRTINDVANKLDAHLTAYETHAEQEAALLNQGKGAWRIAAWFLGFAQVLAMGAIGVAYTELTNIKNDVVEVKSAIAVLKSEVEK